jgi:hypothetical protein
MSSKKLYEAIASTVQARLNCIERGNTEWRARHEVRVLVMVKQHMPHGAGIDVGTRLDLDASTGERLVFLTSFHHMDQNGCYDCWTDHTVTVRGSLQHEIDLKISGSNRNDIKAYLHEVFYETLTRAIVEEA